MSDPMSEGERVLPVPKVTEMRFSLPFDGWFWRVEVDNPWATDSPFDQRVIEKGYARRRGKAEREARRAIKSLNKRLARAQSEQSDEMRF